MTVLVHTSPQDVDAFDPLIGPIREYYLVTAADTPDESQHRIEVCWPIFRTAAS